MNNEKKTWKELKAITRYIAECYKKAKMRLLYNNYTSSQIDGQLEVHDATFVTFVDDVLERCPKRSSLFLQANYFENSDEKLYYQSLSRSTVYRIHKKAVEDFNDCLNY